MANTDPEATQDAELRLRRFYAKRIQEIVKEGDLPTTERLVSLIKDLDSMPPSWRHELGKVWPRILNFSRPHLERVASEEIDKSGLLDREQTRKALHLS